jgi:uncharacterized protein (DUF1778 family)
MATKKVTRGGAKARPDLYSKKRSGIIKTGIRIDVSDNKLIRKAAELERMSQSLWMVITLVDAAKERIAAEDKPNVV